MKVINIKIDELPINCHECGFMTDKWCTLKKVMCNRDIYGSTFVINNRDKIDDKCPLKRRVI